MLLERLSQLLSQFLVLLIFGLELRLHILALLQIVADLALQLLDLLVVLLRVLSLHLQPIRLQLLDLFLLLAQLLLDLCELRLRLVASRACLAVGLATALKSVETLLGEVVDLVLQLANHGVLVGELRSELLYELVVARVHIAQLGGAVLDGGRAVILDRFQRWQVWYVIMGAGTGHI